MRLVKYKKNKISDYIFRGFIFIFISFVCSILIINYIYKRFNDVLLPIAEERTRKFITTIINNSTIGIDFGRDITYINKDGNDSINLISYNNVEVIKLLDEITFNIQNNLNSIEKGNYSDGDDYIVTKIPFGIIFKNPLLRNFGPNINVRLNLVGDIISNIETEVKPYGINNAYVEVRVNLSVTGRIIMPFVSDEVKVDNVIPISINIVSGNVPSGYVYSYK